MALCIVYRGNHLAPVHCSSALPWASTARESDPTRMSEQLQTCRQRLPIGLAMAVTRATMPKTQPSVSLCIHLSARSLSLSLSLSLYLKGCKRYKVKVVS